MKSNLPSTAEPPDEPMPAAQVPPVSFHFQHDSQHQASSYLIVVPDKTIMMLPPHHPLRTLVYHFNRLRTPSDRLAALATALRAAEQDGLLHPGFWAALKRRVRRWLTRRTKETT